MRLLITEPTALVADHADVASLRAEDASGGFGILDGHADFLTVLAPSVLTWRHGDGRLGFCAVRQGVLSMRGGREVAVATRQAQLGTDIETLERTVIDRFMAEDDAERAARIAAARLHMEAIRRIIAALRPDQSWSGAPG